MSSEVISSSKSKDIYLKIDHVHHAYMFRLSHTSITIQSQKYMVQGHFLRNLAGKHPQLGWPYSFFKRKINQDGHITRNNHKKFRSIFVN
mgnify:CR=1 FL=1